MSPHRLPTRIITYMAALVALSLALRAVPVPPGMHGMLRFAALPVILAGFLLNPKAGFWVGVISDLLCCCLFPIGPYFPGLTITHGLTGALPALICRNDKNSFLSVLWGVACGQTATKLFLVPICLHFVYGFTESWISTWKLLFWPSLIVQSVHIPIYAWLIYLILKAVGQNSSQVLSYEKK
ncbi:folate family ECF transporter S component [bacterium]|nr:folate family ECF transporter S component [bacterium]